MLPSGDSCCATSVDFRGVIDNVERGHMAIEDLAESLPNTTIQCEVADHNDGPDYQNACAAGGNYQVRSS